MYRISSSTTLLMYFWVSLAFAFPAKEIFYRDFWNPTYHVKRLAYCHLRSSTCGLPVANDYCHLMGYKKATKAIVAHNVGLTHYLNTHAGCKGWQCDGFSLIRCEAQFNHHIHEDIYLRQKRFVFPRLQNDRIGWCYQENKGCGGRAAYSFCRRMGYAKAISYKIDETARASKSIGDNKLCYGPHCPAFTDILCFR